MSTPRLKKYLLNKKKNQQYKVLFLNHKEQQCGVYQYGKRLYNILRKCTQVQYEYKEVNTVAEYNNILNQTKYDAVIYNYHISTMQWLDERTICRRQQNIGILHECNSILFHKIISIDPNAIESHYVYAIPRPIFDKIPTTNKCINVNFQEFISSYQDQDGIPIFGSFGFGFNNKGFPTIVKMINEQYEKAIIKFVITCAHFGGDLTLIKKLCDECFQQKTKPDIILMIYTDFISEDELLNFLQSNTMNIFLYDKMDGRGISSTIDYALSVKRPLGISDSFMFRHIYHDQICLYKNSIEDCMKNSVSYCE